MHVDMLARGWLIGIGIAAPVGPIGLLCIQRTLAAGRLIGLATGLGAATADALYGVVAAFGLAAISGRLVAWQDGLALSGGIFLCYLGVRTFLTPPVTGEDGAPDTDIGLVAAYLTTFLLTLTNPVTILAFVAIFAGMGLASAAGSYGSALLLVLGVFAGSASWWLLLSGGVSLVRHRLSARILGWINRAAGLIIGAFGLIALASFWL